MSSAAADLLEAIRALPLEERLQLGQTVLEEAVADSPLTDEMKAEFDRRLAAAAANPERSTPWEVVRERVRQRYLARRNQA